MNDQIELARKAAEAVRGLAQSHDAYTVEDIAAVLVHLEEIADLLPKPVEGLPAYLNDQANNGNMVIGPLGTDVAGIQCDVEEALMETRAAAFLLKGSLSRVWSALEHVSIKV